MLIKSVDNLGIFVRFQILYQGSVISQEAEILLEF